MRSDTTRIDRRRAVALCTSGLLLAATLTIFVTPAAAEATLDGCPHSQGFWKHHADLWPADGLTLGAATYDADALLDLLGTPTKGDASMILAHQLIAAKLNVAGGAIAAPFEAPVAEADELLAAFDGVLPYEVKNQRGPPSAERTAMLATAGTLDALNNEEAPAACGTPPSEQAPNVGVRALGSTGDSGEAIFELNVSSNGTEAATGVIFSLSVTTLDADHPSGGWVLRVASSDPADLGGSVACTSVTVDATFLNATCEIGLDMAPGDWLALSLTGSSWTGDLVTLDASVEADLDAWDGDDQATASLGA